MGDAVQLARSPGRLNLSNASINSNDVHSFMKTAIEAESSGSSDLIFSGTGAVQIGDKWKAAGVILMTEGSRQLNWTMKPQPFISTFTLVSTHVGTCSQLAAYVSGMKTVQKRRDEFGANIGETVRGSKGGEFAVEVVYYCVDVTGKIRDPSAEFDSLNDDITEVVRSDLFRKTYLDCMRENPKTSKLADRIKSENHSTWRSYANCRKVSDYQAPLNKYLLDADVKQAMVDLTGKTDPSTWTDSERFIAFSNGVIPGTLS
jgi:hypothetical protein